MPAALVGSAVKATGANVSQVQVTKTGVASGNTLALGVALYEPGGATDGVPTSVTSSPSNTWGQNLQSPDINAFSGHTRATIYTAANVASGDTTVTMACQGASYAVVTVAEFSGMPSSVSEIATDGTNSGTSSTPTSGVSGTPSQSDGLALACLAVPSATQTNEGIDLPSGYTNLGIEQDAANIIGFSFDYKVKSDVLTENASWGTLVSSSDPWSGGVVDLAATAAAPPSSPTAFFENTDIRFAA